MLAACGTRQAGGVETVTVEELKAIIDADSSALLIDVRRPEEYVAYHVPAVKQLIVHSHIPDAVDRLPAHKDTTIYVICRTGRRSRIAGKELLKLGYTHVFNVLGGTNEWRDKGFAVDSGSGILGGD